MRQVSCDTSNQICSSPSKLQKTQLPRPSIPPVTFVLQHYMGSPKMSVRKVELTQISLSLLTLLTPYLGNNSRLLKKAPQQILSLMAHQAFKDAQVTFSNPHQNDLQSHYFKVNGAICSGLFGEVWDRIIYFSASLLPPRNTNAFFKFKKKPTSFILAVWPSPSQQDLED